MRKILLIAGAVAALVSVLALSTDGNSAGQGRSLAANAALGIRQEPILNFDVSGSTFGGPFHSRFTVYNNGLITGSDCNGLFGTNSAGTAFASVVEVEKLRKELFAAGGFKLLDQSISVADIPLTTVTVFRGDTDSRTHTFSYWIGIGNYAAIAQVISDFAAAHPTSCSGIILQSN